MALTIQASQAYFLLAGLYLGKLTNLPSDILITLLVLYIVSPEIYTEDRMTRIKNYFWSWFRFPAAPPVATVTITEDKMKMLEYHLTSHYPTINGQFVANGVNGQSIGQLTDQQKDYLEQLFKNGPPVVIRPSAVKSPRIQIQSPETAN